MNIVKILFQSHTDDSDIDFLVNTFALEAILQNNVGAVSDFPGHLNGSYAGFQRLDIGYLLGCSTMAHEQSEEEEEHEEQGEAREYDAHGHHGDAESVGVFPLQHVNFALAGLNEIVDTGSDTIRCLYLPGVGTLVGACKGVVGSDGRNGDRVNQVDSVTVVEGNPRGLLRIDFNGQVQGTFGRCAVAEK